MANETSSAEAVGHPRLKLYQFAASGNSRIVRLVLERFGRSAAPTREKHTRIVPSHELLVLGMRAGSPVCAALDVFSGDTLPMVMVDQYAQLLAQRISTVNGVL